MLYNSQSMRSNKAGFTLVELLVVTIIISLGLKWSLPGLIRSVKQREVDNYTQIVESGLFSLQAKVGKTKSSCEINFGSSNQFKAPWEILEFQQPSGTQAFLNERISCCNSREGCVGGPEYRLISREGMQDRNAVEISTSKPFFEISPPGTSAEASILTILIRSKSHDLQSLKNKSGKSRLKIRCVEISGSGNISNGTWSEESEKCLI